MENSVKNEDLTLLQGQYEDFIDVTREARALWKKCRDYRDGKQFTSVELEKLKKRGQPAIVDNKIQDKCDTLLGIEKQMRTDPKAFPRTPQHDEDAEAATDSLRYVADSCDYQRTARAPAADNLIVEGFCAGQVIVEKAKTPKVCMEHIRTDRVYFDPHSLRHDFSDKEFAGMFVWMDADKVKRSWKGKDDIIDASFTSGESLHGPEADHDDKPALYTFVKGGVKRVQVFETYYRKAGVWHYAKWVKGGFLEGPMPSPYLDQLEEPDCAIEIQALYRDSHGNPYGSVPRWLDPQDEHNKRRSKLMHLLNSRRVIAPVGTFIDPAGGDGLAYAREQFSKADGMVEVIPGLQYGRDYVVEDNLALAEGQWKLLQYTDAQLSQTGPNAALMGLSGDISGRAKQLDQQSGSLPISPLFDALDGWEVRMYRQAWNRIRQFWTGETWVRVTDNEKNVRFAVPNKQTTAGEIQASKLKRQKIPPEQLEPMVQQLAMDPASQQPAIQNNVAEMDVDIIIDRTQDTVNIQQEQFEILSKLAEGRPEVPFAALVQASQLRSDIKKLIVDQISGQNDPAAQQMAQMQQQLAALEAALKESQVMKTRADADLSDARADQIRAQTVTGVADAMNPDSSLIPQPQAEKASPA